MKIKARVKFNLGGLQSGLLGRKKESIQKFTLGRHCTKNRDGTKWMAVVRYAAAQIGGRIAGELIIDEWPGGLVRHSA